MREGYDGRDRAINLACRRPGDPLESLAVIAKRNREAVPEVTREGRVGVVDYPTIHDGVVEGCASPSPGVRSSGAAGGAVIWPYLENVVPLNMPTTALV